MDAQVWAKLHGASVHFPIAMVLTSAVLDIAGHFSPRAGRRSRLQSAGYWGMVVGALGTVPAVVSGLLMTRGVMLGHDQLRIHHLFAWPAFVLIVGTAAWRVLSGNRAGGPLPRAYL